MCERVCWRVQLFFLCVFSVLERGRGTVGVGWGVLNIIRGQSVVCLANVQSSFRGTHPAPTTVGHRQEASGSEAHQSLLAEVLLEKISNPLRASWPVVGPNFLV